MSNTKLDVLKNSGYAWAIEAAEIMEEMRDALDIVDDLTRQHGTTYPHIQEVLKKFKEWNEKK